MSRGFLAAVLALLWWGFLPGEVAVVHGQTPEPKSPSATPKGELANFNSRLLTAVSKHLERLIESDAKVADLKGKSADGETAMAFYQMYELTGNAKYRTAAVALADRIVKDMKATKHGVLYIKEKETAGGETIDGGGPPALGWYSAAAAYILHKEGGRNEDIKYIATVIDNFPWNKDGWWANSIDIKTGKPKVPLTNAGAINKSAAMAMCAGMVATYVKPFDSELATRLKEKADTCLFKKIIPAQEADGFWHYGFKGTDPKNKDVLGYFMVSAHTLVQLQACTDSYRDKTYQAALDKAFAFAAATIVPMTDPNPGPAQRSVRASAGTPEHYKLSEDSKRGFQLGVLLFAAKNHTEGMKIMDSALKHFAIGNTGTDGAHAVGPSALMLVLLQREGIGPKAQNKE